MPFSPRMTDGGEGLLNRYPLVDSLLRGLAFVNRAAVVLLLIGFLAVASGGEAETPFRVGLWGSGRPERVEAFRNALQTAVGSELLRAGYTGVEVDYSGDYERRFEDLREGRFALLETEPATYFLARSRWLAYDPQRWQYELIFQQLSSETEPSKLRGTILSRAQDGLRTPEDLQGKILGIRSLYGLASGGIQLIALRRMGLERGQQLRVVQGDSESSLCKALFSGLVDAIALPEGRLETFVLEEGAGRVNSSGLVTLYQSSLLPGPLWCVHQRLIGDHPDLVAVLRQGLPTAWSNEVLLPTRDAYYLTTNEWVQDLEGP